MRDLSDFRTSSFCSSGACIGVAVDADSVTVADLPDGEAVLRVSREQWSAFVAGVKAGEFDVD